MSFPEDTHSDVVFVNSLQLHANIGKDCWNRRRPQIVNISVFIHLQNSYLTRAGESDDVRDSVHYGHLSKAVSKLVENPDTVFEGTTELIDAVTEEAFKLAGDAASGVRVVVEVPKFILLAENFSVDVMVPSTRTAVPRKVSIHDLILIVLIGVNPPEREAKQRVIVNLVFFELPGQHSAVDYSSIVSKISTVMEATSYLTLEKFVMDVVRLGCLSSNALRGVTARAQKPSALTFAHSSGVEITRERSAFLL